MTRTNLDKNHVGPITFQEGAAHWGMAVNKFDNVLIHENVPYWKGTDERMCEFQFVLFVLGKPKAKSGWRQSPPRGADQDWKD